MKRIELKPDKKRIVEINNALQDKSGTMAKQLLIKYDEEDTGRRSILRDIL